MKLSDLRGQGRTVALGSFSMQIRDAGPEYLLAAHDEVQAMKAELGLQPTDSLPVWADVKAGVLARAGTYCVSFSGVEDDSGNAIPFRLEDGSINREGALKVLSIAEVLKAMDETLASIRADAQKAREEVEKNFEGPLPVN